MAAVLLLITLIKQDKAVGIMMNRVRSRSFSETHLWSVCSQHVAGILHWSRNNLF